MKRPFAGLVLGLVLCLPSVGVGQSLGTAAQKEHERREKVEKAGGPARTVKDEDLASNRGKVANQAQPPLAPAPEGEGEDTPDGEPAIPVTHYLGEGSVTAPPAGNNEEFWRGRVAAARGRIATAQRTSDSLQRQIRFGQPAHYNESGQRVIYSIYQMKAKADAAEAELKAAEKAIEDLYAEARHEGALPGWLR